MIRTSQKHWIDPEPEDRLDRAIEIALIGLLAFMPIAFGAVEAWSEEVVVIVAAAISICFWASSPMIVWCSMT